jgi:hypothetical protein
LYKVGRPIPILVCEQVVSFVVTATLLLSQLMDATPCMAPFQLVEGRLGPGTPKEASKDMINRKATVAFLVAVAAEGAASSAGSQQGSVGSTGPTAQLSPAARMREFAPVGRAGTAAVLVLVDTVGMRAAAVLVQVDTAGMRAAAGTVAGMAAGMAVGTAAVVAVAGAGRTAVGLVRS